jgi:broad specificity phosphatase PhoE
MLTTTLAIPSAPTQVLRRVDASLLSLLAGAAATETRCVAAVSHSAFLRVVLATLLNVSLAEATVALKFANAGVTVVDFDSSVGAGGHAAPDSATKRDLTTTRSTPTTTTTSTSRTHHRILRLNETRHLQGSGTDMGGKLKL